MIGRLFVVLLVCTVCFTSCKSRKPTYQKKHRTVQVRKPIEREPIKDREPREEETVVVEPPANIPYTDRVAHYISAYSDIAKEEMLQYGIPASIKLAQGILESGAGAGDLTVRANNHFGIKCHKGWQGESVYHDDDELGECFRKYTHPKYSFRDHSLFLSTRSRYSDLFKLRKDDYKGWARGLRKAGYATDPRYPEKLISIIERYSLYEYDQQVLGNRVQTSKPDDTKISTYSVQAGDTLYSISRRFNLTVDTLKKYNGLESNEISIGQILYLHPVNN